MTPNRAPRSGSYSFWLSAPQLTAGLTNYCRDNYIGWGPEADGEGLARAWSGTFGCVGRTR